MKGGGLESNFKPPRSLKSFKIARKKGLENNGVPGIQKPKKHLNV